MAGKKLEDFQWLGNHPVLDFLNTVNNRHHPNPEDDFLQTFEELVGWHELTGLITKVSGRNLREQARKHPRKAAEAHANAIALRELLYKIFYTLVQAEKPREAELCELNSALNRLRPCCLLAAGDHALEWRWHIDPEELDSLLGPLVESAAALLTSDNLGRIRECPPPHGCGWLFLDTSKNGSRHWCSMKTCGNLAKVRRHRSRASARHPAA